MNHQVNFHKFALVITLIFGTLFSAAHTASAQEKAPAPAATPAVAAPQGKPPVIVIPGLIGSELINKSTKETVWFDLGRSKNDDLRLPISPNLAANKDELIAGDILRNFKYLKFLPATEIYQKLTESLEQTGGYKEGKWDAPAADGFQDTYYVYPYDWRLDNVENARLLIRRIEALKKSLNRPDLRFNVIAHSMGGLIARYAARFGDADLPAGSRTIRPTWAGARHISKIFLIGTPNEGSVSALDSLINGFTPFDVRGINIPFVQSISRYDTFSIPAIYQLLPHGQTIRAFDENLKRIPIDIYNPQTWEKYGWATYQQDRFAKEFKPDEVASARIYFRSILQRTKRFHQSLDSVLSSPSPVRIYLIGSECKPTLEGIVIYRDKKEWKTIFKPSSFKKSDGTKVNDRQLQAILNENGDGVVARSSLLTSDLESARRRRSGYKTALQAEDVFFTCETHNRLTGNAEVQKKMFETLLQPQPVRPSEPVLRTTRSVRASRRN